MGSESQGGLTVVEHAMPALFDETQDWIDFMDKSDKSDAEIALAPVTNKMQEGFKAYVRDLPKLLKSNREGYMIAYHGSERVALAASDDKLHQILERRPQYNQIKEDTFVTRVTAMDATEFGVRL